MNSDKKSGIFLKVSRDGWTDGVQLSIGDGHGGYRIAGPKFNGSSTTLLTRELTERDITEIRMYLDEAEKALKTLPQEWYPDTE